MLRVDECGRAFALRTGGIGALLPILLLVILTSTPGCPREVALVEECALSGNGAMPWSFYPFADGCGDVVDFGMAPLGATTSRILAVYNNGTGADLAVTSIALTNVSGMAATFTLSFSTATGPGVPPSPATLPATLSPGDDSTGALPTVLYVQIDFDGSTDPFPTEELQILSNDSTRPSVLVSITGSTSDCPPGFWDLDGDPGNGCEYECTFMNATDDCLTAGVDDNCDGVVDDEDSDNCTDYYRDMDGDGFGDAADFRCLCAPDAPHTATNGDDCDDMNGTIGDPNSPTNCGLTCGTAVDCNTLASTDSDGSPTAYQAGGTVEDFTTCMNGACISDSYPDSCAGSMLTEYGASGSSFTSSIIDCSSMEGPDYCLPGNLLYRDVWDCSGTPGACVDTADMIVADCALGGSCNGTCGSGLNGCTVDVGSCVPGGGGADATCVGAATDVDLDLTGVHCNTCGLEYGIGGEVAATDCCGDDSGEFERLCDETSPDGACGGDPLACCDAADDCVDGSGLCRTSGTCHPFGSGSAYCAAGTWEDPDAGLVNCQTCGGSWYPSVSSCCGNDTGEDFESVGASACCYNAANLWNGTLGHSDNLLCDGGELYDCNNNVSDASGIDATSSTNTVVGSFRCDAGGRWCSGNTIHCGGGNDCETNLNSNPSSSSATALGVGLFPAQTAGGACIGWACETPVSGVTGVGEVWYTFQAYNSTCNCGGQRVELDLVVPPGVDYDLRLYRDNASNLVDSSLGGSGADEEVHHCWADACGVFRTFWVSITWYAPAAGYTCSPWSLSLSTHNCGGCP